MICAKGLSAYRVDTVIVFVIKDDRLREKLFRDENLTLQKAIQLCQAHEATMRSMQTMKEETISQ